MEIRNIADSLLYTVEKTLKDAGDKVEIQDKKDVEEKLDALRKVKDGEAIEEIQKATQELSEVIQKIGASLSKQGQQQEQPQAEETKEDDKKPEDGEFKEKK